MGTVSEVQLKFEEGEELTCTITFLLSNEATLLLCYSHPIGAGGNRTLVGKLRSDLFSRASRTILDHPLVESVRALWIRGGGLLAADPKLAANDVGSLFGSMGPLDKLCLDACDLRPYLDPFLETPLFPDLIQPTSIPPVKELTIINPIQSLCHNDAYAAAVVKLAKSQHTRGMPFDHVRLKHWSLTAWLRN